MPARQTPDWREAHHDLDDSNTASVNKFKKSRIGSHRGPHRQRKSNSTATSSTCKMSPFAKASTTVVGMICIRKSEMLAL